MKREEESICCQEVDAVRNKIFEDVREERLQAEPRCIKQYPGFEAVCNNTSSSRAVLRGLSIRKTATLLTGK